MIPALIALGELCKRRELDLESDHPVQTDEATNMFATTAEGRRVIAAVKKVSQLVVRDGDGHVVAWDSIAITDSETLTAIGKARAIEAAREAPIPSLSQFTISLTLAQRRMSRDTTRPARSRRSRPTALES
jgi:hypothetical protein